MGSIQGPIIGEFFLPVITPETDNGNPWKRNYFAPPQHLNLVSRKYPLFDIRPVLEEKDYSPTKLLQSHGFGVVKHRSRYIDLLQQEEEVPENALTEVYHPEVEELVLKTTGAKKVFVLATGLRQGKRAPGEYKPPTGVRSASEAVQDVSKDKTEEQPKHKLAGQNKLMLAAPVRKPHMDFTPLGARQEIRSKSVEINQAAKEAGIIDFEDSICARYANSARTVKAEYPIAENYNANGKLGPRYAAYSIWRPLKKAQRDPIALSPRRETRTAEGENVYWPYENRIPGIPELNGDYLKEYAALGVKAEEPEEESSMEWFYISGQEADEVLFIKLFDSAALGKDSQHMSAPWHASPEIGSVEGDEPRESIDVRVLVFW